MTVLYEGASPSGCEKDICDRFVTAKVQKVQRDGAHAPARAHTIEAVAMTTEESERDDSLIAAFARKGEVLYAA